MKLNHILLSVWLLPLLLFSFGQLQQTKYMVTAPKQFRPGTPYYFSVSTFERKSVEYKLLARMESYSGSILLNETFTLASDATVLLKLEIPGVVPEDRYKFCVNASRGVTFVDSEIVEVNRKVHSIFIQTDKYLYKPGQTVQYRVIAVDAELKPYNGMINVTIRDTAKNKITELVNIQNDRGVITNKLSLSDVTPLGTWSIEAKSEHASIEINFQVAEYVLPKFEVTVELPSFYYINTNNPSMQADLRITVIAKYTYGQPVQGAASVQIKISSFSWMNPSPPAIIKFIELKDGKADVPLSLSELNILLPPTWGLISFTYQTLFVEANVTEAITGITLSAKNTVPCKPNRFQLQFLSNSAETFKNGLPYHAYLQLERSDGMAPSLSDIQTINGQFKKIDITVTSFLPYVIWYYRKQEAVNNFSIDLTEDGYASFSYPTDLTAGQIEFKATFYDDLGKETITAFKSVAKCQTRSNEGMQITMSNREKIIKPSTSVTFQVRTTNKISSYQYQILAKGQILASQKITLNAPSTEDFFVIQVSEQLALKMAPEARIVVSYVTSTDEIIADNLAINVADYFINKVTLSFNKNQTEPGDENVVLNVEARNNSFVGLLAVDQSVLLLSAGNDLTESMINKELQMYKNSYNSRITNGCLNCRFWWPIWLGGSDTFEIIDNSGLFILTNLLVHRRQIFAPTMPVGRSGPSILGMPGQPGAAGLPGRANTPTFNTVPPPSDKGNSQFPVTVRNNFPETFIWTDEITKADGTYQLKLKIPDSITSWIATGFALNRDVGLGLSENPAKLTVIKPFFISLNLPYSIIRGEEFALQVTVFNYLEQDLTVAVKLLSSSYFKTRQCNSTLLLEAQVTKSVSVANNDAASVYFWVVASSLGQIPFEVHALAGLAADAIKQTILVKPEGKPESYSSSILIQLEREEKFNSMFDVSLPPAGVLVLGSVIIEVNVLGDIMGSSLSGIENLLQMPYGCGEQNMLNLVPDVYLLQYLTESGQLTAEFEQKAKKFVFDGYQRELTYQRTDGSFSAFGNLDSAGSIWLSSFVIKSFHQAKEYIPVEDDKIAKTLNWITSLQNANGSFSEPPGGRVIHTDMQGGSSSGVALTAYVLISLLENQNNTLVSSVKLEVCILKSMRYLEEQISSHSTDPYALAILSYALFRAGSPNLENALFLLNNLAINDGGMKYWEKDEATSSSNNRWTCPYPQSKSFNIEITSYALLVYAKQNDLQNSLPIVKWLVKQRNAFGGFSSTQDTVLALEALSSVASFFAPSPVNAGVTITIQGNQDSTPFIFATITKNNSLSLQSTELSENTTSVDVHGTGAGVALLQLIVQYNVEVTNKAQFLSLQLSTIVSKKELTLEISTNWSGDEVSGMVIVEVNLLTGYSISNEKEIIQQIGSTFKKFEQTFNKIIIYLDELTSDKLVFDVKISEMLPVANVKPAAVKVYRYYDPSSFVSGFYSPSGGQTWQGACPLCCGKQ